MAAVLIWILFGPSSRAGAVAPEPVRRVTLATKDARFRIIPPERGGATASVWYATRGDSLPILLRAAGLVPGRRYRVVLSVDGVPWAIASRAADAGGGLVLDTTLAAFANGVCVGNAWRAPAPLRGTHRIDFWVRHDGAPRSGTLPVTTPTARPGARLPCSGDGDGDDRWVLLENATAVFTGTDSAPRAAP